MFGGEILRLLRQAQYRFAQDDKWGWGVMVVAGQILRLSCAQDDKGGEEVKPQ